MPTRDRKAALGSSLKAEEAAVQSRFERAETVLARNELASLGAPLSRRNALPEEEPKVKRDSFTMPLPDYELIGALQKRCLQAQTRASKSEILRAGLMALSVMTDAELAEMVDRLPKVKTGRRPGNTV
jgi:hypothetical protein